MAKDASARSSAGASIHSPSLHEDDEDGTKDPSGGAPNDTTESPPLPVDSSNLAVTAASNARPAESQPMTASNSSSSNPSAKEAASSGTGSAVPYGTRSRNRTGTSRPNYAEDKELDAEFELAPSSKDTIGKKAGRANDVVNGAEAGRAANAARKNPSSEIEHTLTIQSHYREPIPGTSTFSANPAVTGPTQHSKKRKAASQTGTFQTQTQASTQNLSAPQAVTRRASMAAQVVAGFRDSNMLSFEICAGRMTGKTLIADDGTLLEVNGRFIDL